jgi:hypothetical protein
MLIDGVNLMAEVATTVFILHGYSEFIFHDSIYDDNFKNKK